MTEKVERLVEKRPSWRNEDETSNPHEWFQRNDEKITVGGKRRPEMQRLPASETRAANEMRANFQINQWERSKLKRTFQPSRYSRALTNR